MNRRTNGSYGQFGCRGISLLLALALLLTLLPAVPLAVRAAGEGSIGSVTLYFKNTQGWDSVYGYACSMVKTQSSLLRSPQVSGNQVTFRYKAPASQKIYVVGTMNGWSQTASPMTRGSDGVYKCTMTLAEGAYEYKFYNATTGAWLNDPSNLTYIGSDSNNCVVVTPVAATAGKITVKLHFYRPSGDYSGWDVWAWADGMDGKSYALTDDGQGKVATITVDGGVSELNYIIRKSDWSDREFAGVDRAVDLSGISAGTVHHYVSSGVAATTQVFGNDTVPANKITSAYYNYSTGKLEIKTALPITENLAGAFTVYDKGGEHTGIQVLGVQDASGTYILRLDRRLDLGDLYRHRVTLGRAEQSISAGDVFGTEQFEVDYIYQGDDLGANWSKSATTFQVWAPTAEYVYVKIFHSGNHGYNDLYKEVKLTKGDKGVWSVTVH